VPTTRPTTISWLAGGDSYASGAGLTRTTEPCADGIGTPAAPSKAWAIVASQSPLLAGEHFGAAELVACTGAKTGEFFSPQGHDPAQWRPSMGPFDLVTFSFGGDNIGFPSVVLACLDRTGDCTDQVVRERISALGQSYPAFLTKVATSAVVPGGNVVVMGYPELVENPNLWPAAVHAAHICQGFVTNDANLIRGWAGDLNATIGYAVSHENALPAAARNGVHFTFIDVVTGQTNTGISASNPNLFEPETGLRHELCSDGDDAWLNGLSPLHIHTRSFHPNQAGEDAMGRLAAEVISRLSWPWTPTGVMILDNRGYPVPAPELTVARKVLSLAEEGDAKGIASMLDPNDPADPAIARELQLLEDPGVLSAVIKVLTQTHATVIDSVIWPGFTHEVPGRYDASDMAAMGVVTPSRYHGIIIAIFDTISDQLLVSVLKE
jgi:hypothetical protein